MSEMTETTTDTIKLIVDAAQKAIEKEFGGGDYIPGFSTKRVNPSTLVVKFGKGQDFFLKVKK